MKSKFYTYLLLSLLWTALIFLVSSIPSIELKIIEEKPWIGILRKVFTDPVMHFCEFAILAFLMINTFVNVDNLSRIRILKFVLILGASIAVLNEVYQYFIPLRGFQIQDIVMNSSGVICASYLRLFLMKMSA